MPASSRPLLVVDAANVIGSRPDGWWHDRAGAAQRLVQTLVERHADDNDDDPEIVVVLEGKARSGVPAGEGDPVTVVHAHGSGDDAIVSVVATAVGEDPERSVTVVTADRGLRGRVEDLGAQTQGPRWLSR